MLLRVGLGTSASSNIQLIMKKKKEIKTLIFRGNELHKQYLGGDLHQVFFFLKCTTDLGDDSRGNWFERASVGLLSERTVRTMSTWI